MYKQYAMLLGMTPLLAISMVYAEEPVSEPNFNHQPPVPSVTAEPIVETLPSQQQQAKVMSKQESLAYLKSHPDELERLIAQMVSVGNPEHLRDLLPVYQQYDSHDPSLIIWGNAIILRDELKYDEAVKLYRELNALFPEIYPLRFQLAIALLQNRQFQAASSELEKLASSSDISEQDRQMIEQLIASSKSNSNWSFNASANYINDKNLNNSPKAGTKITEGWTYTTPREQGQGVGYSLNANKRWYNDSRLFTGLDLSAFGRYYWDNSKFNDVNAKVGIELGYQDNKKEIAISPYYQKHWYAGGTQSETAKTSQTAKLDDYREATGVQLSANARLNNKLHYYGNLSYTKNTHTDKYLNNNGDDYNISQTLSYNLSPTTYVYGGVDYFKRNVKLDYNSYAREGMRLGWGQVWDKGFATRASVGYGVRQYNAADFFGFKRRNEEMTANLSVWNRGVSVFGLTPRLNLSYTKVDSNSPIEKYGKGDVSVELTKTF